MRWLVLALCPTAVQAEAVVLTRSVPARSTLTSADVTVVQAEIAGALTDPASVPGLQTRIALRAGQPLTARDVTRPHLVRRNQSVTLRYRLGQLYIAAEGRALSDAALGERASAMNMASHLKVDGQVLADGSVLVAPQVQP